MLPKLEYPEHEFVVPSTGKKVSMRPFTVREEKILLMALDGDSPEEMYKSTESLLKACSNNALDVEKLSSFDVEYLFLQLRAKSVSPTVDLAYKNNNCPLKKDEKDKTCDTNINVSVNLEEAQVQKKDADGNWTALEISKDGTAKHIQVSKSVWIEVNYPTYKEIVAANEKSDTASELLHALCKQSIRKIWNDESVIEKHEFNEDELNDFYQSILPQHKEEILSYVDTIPALRYEFEYSCPKCEFSTTLKFKGIRDFFG
jgi:hypothetical protein